MKISIFFRVVISLSLALSLFACEMITDKNDECDASKMPEQQSPTVYLQLLLRNDTIDDNLDILTASKATFSGTITKVYCSGTVSSSFAFNHTFYPAESDSNYLFSGFYLDQPYQFNFDNDKDYLLLIAKMKVWLPNGKIYESLDVTKRFYYKNIAYDVNQIKKYILIPFGKNVYVEVNSK